jgi:class 3 adenylate cyclase
MSAEPQIRYCTTSDGVSIAWGDAGQGPALLYCGATPFSHIQDHYAIFEDFYEKLARSFRVITFDARGTGMSQRAVANVSLATLLVDAEAVIEAAKLEHFVVFADMTLLAAASALQIATRLPEQVTHIVLESPFQNMRELDATHLKIGLALAEVDWGVYVQTVFRVLSGWDAADIAWLDPMARAAAGWVYPAVGLEYTRLQESTDLGAFMGLVHQPALVLRLDPSYVPAAACQRVAAKIHGAQFRQYADPDGSRQPALIRTFAGQPPPEPAPQAASAPSGTAIILFTDIVDSTALTERLGDTMFRTASRTLDEGMRAAMRESGGTPVEGKVLGDGVMGVFTSAAQAIAAARRCIELSAESELQLHVGLHAGDVIHEKGNVYGGAVNIASRVCGLSAPGEVLVSGTVRELARTSAGVEFEDRGEQALKGIDDAVRVYEVRWRG